MSTKLETETRENVLNGNRTVARHHENSDASAQWWGDFRAHISLHMCAYHLKKNQDNGKALKVSQIKEVGI